VSSAGLVVKLGAAGWSLRSEEVDVLIEWLNADGSQEAQSLTRDLTDRRAMQMPTPMQTLGIDGIAAVRSVLCGTDLSKSDYHGLRGLQAAICTELPA
jgi:hypothetical protein